MAEDPIRYNQAALAVRLAKKHATGMLAVWPDGSVSHEVRVPRFVNKLHHTDRPVMLNVAMLRGVDVDREVRAWYLRACNTHRRVCA